MAIDSCNKDSNYEDNKTTNRSAEIPKDLLIWLLIAAECFLFSSTPN